MAVQDWLQRFLFVNTRQILPDGRPLYAYKCGDKKYAELRDLARENIVSAFVGKSALQIGPIFCLYAAETFCREHAEGAWTWETVFRPLDMDAPVHKYIHSWVERGLDWWRRPLIRGSNDGRRFLTSIACEGGLPLRLLRKENANLRLYFRAVLENYHASGFGGTEVAEAIARQHTHRLPPSLRQDVVFHLGGELIAAVSELQRQIGEDAKPIAALDVQIPDWRRRFPLRLEEETAEALFGALIRRSGELSREEKSRLRWVTRLVERGNEWVLEKELEFPERVRSTQISNWIGQSNVANPRLRLILRKAASVEVIAWLTVTQGANENALYRREWLGRGGVKLSGCAVTEPHQIFLQDGQKEYPLSVQDGDPWGSLPWIFTKKQSTQELIGLSQGSAHTRNNEAWVVAESALSYQTTDGATCEQAGVLNFLPRVVYRVSGSVEFVTLELDRYRIDCGAERDTDETFALEGKTLTEALNQRPLYLRLPRILTIQADGKKEFATGRLQWRRIGGGGTWQDNNSTCKGRVWLRLVDLRGIERFRRQLDVLPSSFRIERNMGTDRQPGIYSLYGLDDAQVELASQNITIHNDHDWIRLECPSLPGSDLPILVTNLHWPDQGSVELQLPYPQRGAAFQLGGRSLRKDDRIPLGRLGGAQVLLQNQVGAGRYWLDGQLITSEAWGGNGRSLMFRDRLPPLENGRRQVSLSPWLDRIGTLLASNQELEAKVRLEICANHGECVARIYVSRFDAFLEPNRDAYRVAISGDPLERLGDGWDVRVKLEMFPLWAPGSVPIELPLNPEHHACWSIPLGLEPGPWWIVGRDGDWARFRPLMWMVNPSDVNQATGEIDKELAAAIREADAEQRSRRIDAVLIALGENPDHPDWPELMEFIRLAREFPPSSLDVLNRLVAYPQTLALGLLKADDSLFDCAWNLAEQMPFSWSMLPVKTWLNAARLHVQCLRDALGEIDTNGEITFTQFQGFRERAAARREYWRPLGDWLQEQLFPERPMQGGELKLARQNRTFMEEQIRFAESELQRRHDADEQWPQSSEAYKVTNDEKFPAAYRFTRLETYFRPVRFAPFVAAHVCLHGIIPTDALIYELRLIRAFDAEWFDRAYAIALTLGLADLPLESLA